MIFKGISKAVAAGVIGKEKITEKAIKMQRDAVCANIGAYNFVLNFTMEKVEVQRMNDPQYREFREKHTGYARFSQFIVGGETYTTGMQDANYKVKVRISPAEALKLLENCGVRLTWSVNNQWKKNGEAPDPSAGIRTTLHFKEYSQEITPYNYPQVDYKNYEIDEKAQLENMSSSEQEIVREKLMHLRLYKADVEVSHEYKIKERYREGETADSDDFFRVRRGIWHEILETVLILIGTEAFCFPLFMYTDLEEEQDHEKRKKENITEIKNFAHDAVMTVQNYSLGDKNKWINWPGDPPFDAWESQARTYEAEVKRLEEITIMLEQQGNFSCAANRWEEAENAWERVVEAWQAIPGHPEREKRISAARAKLAEVREKREIARWKGASWDVTSTSRGEVSIRYSSWPDRFKARIVDVGGNVLTRFDKPGGVGVVTWGKGAKAGVYFIKVKAERVEPTVRKVVVP